MEKVSVEEMIGDDFDTILDDENGEDACPGCNCMPGDGITESCADMMGCGFWRAYAVEHKIKYPMTNW